MRLRFVRSICCVGLLMGYGFGVAEAAQATESLHHHRHHHPGKSHKLARHHSNHARYGKASYYSSRFSGRRTADGSRLDPTKMTAASKTLPLGTVAKVTNLSNHKSAVVVINDRGPIARGRIIDVTPKAAAVLGMKSKGVARVKVEPIGTTSEANARQ